MSIVFILSSNLIFNIPHLTFKSRSNSKKKEKHVGKNPDKTGLKLNTPL